MIVENGIEITKQSVWMDPDGDLYLVNVAPAEDGSMLRFINATLKLTGYYQEAYVSIDIPPAPSFIDLGEL